MYLRWAHRGRASARGGARDAGRGACTLGGLIQSTTQMYIATVVVQARVAFLRWLSAREAGQGCMYLRWIYSSGHQRGQAPRGGCQGGREGCVYRSCACLLGRLLQQGSTATVAIVALGRNSSA